jgi:hypothetical protein
VSNPGTLVQKLDTVNPKQLALQVSQLRAIKAIEKKEIVKCKED